MFWEHGRQLPSISDGTTTWTYTYDAWGICQATAAEEIEALNPLRYRSYFYDGESGLYYLQSRYYDPEIGRFISADAFVSTGQGLLGNNMFAYCGNNPVIRVDVGGFFWDIIVDVVSLAISVYEVCKNPNDTGAWIGLAGDVVDLIPVVSGVGEATRALRTADKAVDVVQIANKTENVIDVAKNSDNIVEVVDDFANKIPVIGKMPALNEYSLGANEFKIADMLPNMGSPKLNWKQNSSVVRKFADGRPIRDISPYPMNNAGFLGAERNLLENCGYKYVGGFWLKGE